MPHNMNCCGRCGKEVYHAEKKVAINKVWHELCFSCVKCNKLLCPANFCTYKNELYCRFCYTKVSQYDIEYSSSDISETSYNCQPTCNNKKPYHPPPNSEIKETSNLKPSEIKNLIKNKLKRFGSNISLYTEKIKTYKDRLTSKKSCVSQMSQCSVTNPELLFVSESGTTKIIKITTPCAKINYCDDNTCPYKQKSVGTPVCQTRKTNTNNKCCKFNDKVIDIYPESENPKKCCKASQCSFLKPDCSPKRSRRTRKYSRDNMVSCQCQNIQTSAPQESHETQYECPKIRHRRKFRRRFRSGSDINLRSQIDSIDNNLRKSDRTRLNLQQSLKNTTYETEIVVKPEEKPISIHKTTSTTDSDVNISEKFDKKYEHNPTYHSLSKTFPKNSKKDSLNHFQTSARRSTDKKQNGDKQTINKTNDKHNLKETIKKESYIPPKYDAKQKQIENPHFLETFEENKPQSATKEHFKTLKSFIPFHKRKTTKTNEPEPVKTSKQDKRDTDSIKLSKVESPIDQETNEAVKLSTNNEKTKEVKENKNTSKKNKNDYAELDDFTTPIKYSFYKTRKENNIDKEESIYPSFDNKTNEELPAKTTEEDNLKNNKNPKQSYKTRKETNLEKEESIYPSFDNKTNEEPPAKTIEQNNIKNSKKQKQSIKKNDKSKKSKDNKENNSKKNKNNKDNNSKKSQDKENKSMLGKLFFFPTAHRKKKLENQKKGIFKRMHSGQCQIHKKISCYEEKFIVTAEICPKKKYIRNSRRKISEPENNIDNNKIVPLPRNKYPPAAVCCEEISTDVASFSKTRRNFSTKSRRLNNELCGRCNKKVYIMERCIADNGVFHKKCFTCFFCKKILDSLSVVPKLNEILCKQCYMRFYGPQLYGFGMKQNLREM